MVSGNIFFSGVVSADEILYDNSFFLQVSIASDTKVFVVICFDRAARVLFGCSADEFFDFVKLHPFAGNPLFYHCKIFYWRLWALWNFEVSANQKIEGIGFIFLPLFGIREIFVLATTFGRNPNWCTGLFKLFQVPLHYKLHKFLAISFLSPKPFHSMHTIREYDL